jgi:site-specific DNA recombinase
MVGAALLRDPRRSGTVNARRSSRCAVYTRKSSEEGLEQSFNSLDAQREACEAYIKSQAHEGWTLVRARYDDGGFSGGSMERPGLKALIADIDRGMVDIVVVYKVDRLTRSLTDFAKIVDVLDRKGASFVSVTQQFNTTTSMGRLTLNVLLSFAQFEREVTGERIRDKVAASKKKGMWMGGFPPLGFDILNRKLAVNAAEAETLKSIFARFLELGSVRALVGDLKRRGVVSKKWRTRHGVLRGGHPFSRGALYYLLRNAIYLGEIRHKGSIHRGEHPAILPRELWDRVQAALDANCGKRSGAERGPSAAFLAGVLFDDKGNRLTPSHVRKRNGRRYRYYVSQALLQQRPKQVGSVARIPAQEIEDLALDRLLRVVGERALPAEEARKCLLRVEVSRDAVKLIVAPRLRLDAAKLQARLIPGDQIAACESGFEITVPVQLKRWGGEKVIEGGDGRSASTKSYLDAPLVKAWAQAHRWREALSSGVANSLEQVAAETGCDESHVRHRIALAFLAPDIVEMILTGMQPRHLTLDRLLKTELPLSWRQQRELFGPASV